jgi:hypothetical protein
MSEDKMKNKNPIYEYLLVKASTTFTKEVPVPKVELPEGVKEGFKKEWETKYFIFWPNKKESETSGAEDILTVFNDLGEKGWKMVAFDVLSSGIFDYEKYNNSEVSIPLERQFIFVRKK